MLTSACMHACAVRECSQLSTSIVVVGFFDRDFPFSPDFLLISRRLAVEKKQHIDIPILHTLKTHNPSTRLC